MADVSPRSPDPTETLPAAEQPFDTLAQPWPVREDVRITRVRAVVTAPEGIPLVVVKVDTSVDGLSGLGCATFTQRWHAVVAFVEQHLARLVVGRYPGDIEDLVRLARLSGYWRDGPVGNNALSGLDMALWNIAGKRAGAPVHELLGGRVRWAADTYLHASGPSVGATVDDAAAIVERGWRHVRLQTSQHGVGTYGSPRIPGTSEGDPYPHGVSLTEYLTTVPRLFAAARERLGPEVELCHDVHSRLTSKQALAPARAVEPHRPFFLEDVLPPEHWDRLPEVRHSSPVPLAVGELATSVTDAARLVGGGGVDLLRCHVSAIGGLTPARKLAALCELTGVRTAWHAPGDTSPVGAAANVALDVSSPAFGIQEAHEYADAVHEVFPGTLVAERGWLEPNEAPGFGIELDEAAAARYPADLSPHDAWAAGARGRDGGLVFP